VTGIRGSPRPEIDWAQVRSRLAAALRSIEEASRPSPEQARAVLDERARALARRPLEDARAGRTIEAVTFSLANERYAIEAAVVREVVRLVHLTPVPGAGAFLAGVTNLRGEMLAVIDLRRFFDLPEKGLTDLSRVIVLGADRSEFGVLADQAHDIVRLGVEELLERPASGPEIAREYVRGVTEDALVVLDGAALLRDSRLYVDHGAVVPRAKRTGGE
jgi:purine-binding chemotaxis protein CheW